MLALCKINIRTKAWLIWRSEDLHLGLEASCPEAQFAFRLSFVVLEHETRRFRLLRNALTLRQDVIGMMCNLNTRVISNHVTNAEPLGDVATPIRVGLYPIESFPVEGRLDLPSGVVIPVSPIILDDQKCQW